MRSKADAAPPKGSWQELLGREHRSVTLVLSGGVALYAVNVYLTTSLLPSAVGEIGGRSLYAWAMTAFLVASVFTSMLVSRTVTRRGPRQAYWIGLALFGAGSVVGAIAPTMPVLLGGRVLQGLGGGLLAGLGFAVVRQALPDHLWQRALGLMSAMWGFGNVVGPIIGGLFAEFGLWRLAFVLLAASAGGVAVVVGRSLPRRAPDGGSSGTAASDRVPVLALALLSLGAAAVSVASVVSGRGLSIALIIAAGLFVVGFILRERRAATTVLPAITYRRGSALTWIYLAVALLAVGSTVETFLPLFGQQIGGLSPLLAGLLGASLSWGWSVSQILSSGITGVRGARLQRIAGPALLGAGLAIYGLLQVADPGPGRVVAWFAVLFVAGSGIGMAFAHWVPAAMRITPDPAEASKASAGVNTTQLISNAFGSALAGLLVQIGGPGVLGSARLLSGGYAALCLVGVAVTVLAIGAERSNAKKLITEGSSDDLESDLRSDIVG
ncbi:MFS transporter [Microlunatus soli]|uniref:Major Facilitator Superfamily protein n=1 Tax=Microlunatus soli TaxID=630515 RepID=A0A1H2A5K3_9ACTN|nr:MFS transporter [Microlunatus soli]SDT41157.1 Major Facilitator Superfamily protein [Microlunatus soli]